MAFKEDASFLKFVTMGATGTRAAMRTLAQQGHRPVELERSAASNKIWRTKIKRLRLPDLLCVECGCRFEVRAKSNLEIKMSDSPANPDRNWDSGLRDDDIVLFLKCYDEPVRAGQTVNAFSVAALRAAAGASKLGPPKSASQGAERDRTWPSWVPPGDGCVTAISGSAEAGDLRISVRYDSGRTYTYAACRKLCHVGAGDHFKGEETIVASVVLSNACLRCPGGTWQPRVAMDDANRLDLYASIKAVRARQDASQVEAVVGCLTHEDVRIALEAAGTSASLGRTEGLRLLQEAACKDGDDAPWAMEAALILREVGTPAAAELLVSLSREAPHAEVRAAAIWSASSLGVHAAQLRHGVTDPDADVRLHTIISLSRMAHRPQDLATLLEMLSESDEVAAAAAEALSRGQPADLCALLRSAATETRAGRWAYGTLSRMPPASVRAASSWSNVSRELRDSLERTWFLPSTSWTVNVESSSAMAILAQQETPDSGAGPEH